MQHKLVKGFAVITSTAYNNSKQTGCPKCCYLLFKKQLIYSHKNAAAIMHIKQKRGRLKAASFHSISVSIIVLH